MSRGSWAGVMVVSLLASGASGFYVFTQIEPKNLLNAPITTTPAATVADQPMPEQKPVEAVLPISTEEKPATRNILFRIPKPSAKSVFIIGDFNDWKRQPLEKKGKTWEITFALKPGAYEYMYVIDDKRVKDPNNKIVKDGKSVINVKPLQ